MIADCRLRIADLKTSSPRLVRVFNRQKSRKIQVAILRKIARCLLEDLLPKVSGYELAIHLVGAEEMARVNMTFLQHEGSTDVITFDYGEGKRGKTVEGELYISVDDAVVQSKEFHTTWQSELVRYVVHGVLHLRGHDDLKPAARRVMKREENRLLKELSKCFALGKLGRVEYAAQRK